MKKLNAAIAAHDRFSLKGLPKTGNVEKICFFTSQKYRTDFMILTATEASGSKIQDIVAQAGETDSVPEMVKEYLKVCHGG